MSFSLMCRRVMVLVIFNLVFHFTFSQTNILLSNFTRNSPASNTIIPGPQTFSYNDFRFVDGNDNTIFSIASEKFAIVDNLNVVEPHQLNLYGSNKSFLSKLDGAKYLDGIIGINSSWKYLDDGSDQGSAWRSSSFNDASWSTGAAELGYGDGDENTVVSYGPNPSSKYITTYFRQDFDITNLNSYTQFIIYAVRDDGIVIYINGVEVARDNMPAGSVNYATQAVAGLGIPQESNPITRIISPCYFQEGTNTIAVEIHQNNGTSADLSFALELIGDQGTIGTPTLTRGPYLQVGTQNSLALRWRTSELCRGEVKVGASAGSYTIATASENCPTTEHEVLLTGLDPDTKYYYQIGETGGIVFQGDGSNFFTTLPDANANRKLRFAAFGDCGRNNIGYQNDSYARYQSFLSTNGLDAPDAWLLLGDNAYELGTDAEYTTNFFDIYSSILKNHKLYPTPGNHDYAGSGTKQDDHNIPYYSIFNMPTNGEAGGVASNNKSFYSYDVGNVHFLALDSYGEESNLRMYDTLGAQAVWVKNDLAANTKKWVVAYWHHPPFTMCGHNSDVEQELIDIRQKFIRILERYGVDLIINGHSHNYERSKLIDGHYGLESTYSDASFAKSTSSATYTSNSTCPYVTNSGEQHKGTVYVVAGSTGASATAFPGYPHDAMPYSLNEGGFFYFEVDDNRLDAKFIRRDNGSVFDQFTLMKDVNQDQHYDIISGASIDLTASWPGNYSWNTAATTRTINVTPPLGTNTYTVTDNFGCIADQFVVDVSSMVPLSLIEYNAILMYDRVAVNWTTSYEKNTKEFLIERSQNSLNFETIGRVIAAGQSDVKKNYTFFDSQPLTGTSYYRLTEVDIDGKIKNFAVKKITNNKLFSVKQLASSVDLILQVSSLRAGKLRLRVIDMMGREIKNESFAVPVGTIKKQVQLSAGSYVWEIQNENLEKVTGRTIIY